MNLLKMLQKPLIALICLIAINLYSSIIVNAKDESLIKASLLLGDTNSRTSIEAIKRAKSKETRADIKGLENVSFHVYPSKGIRSKDLTNLKESKLVIIQTMDRQIVEAIKPELEEAIKKGAKVYGVSGIYDEEHKKMGIILDPKISEYHKHGGSENIKNMLLYALKKDFGLNLSYSDVIKIPEFGIYDYTTKKIFQDFDEFKNSYSLYRADKPWIGIVFYKISFESGQTRHLDAIIESLHESGFNVLPVYGYPSDAVIERFLFDENGNSRVKAVVGMALKVGINPNIVIPLLSKLNVPVINAITLYTQSRDEWEKSPVGLDIFERSWQVAVPEMAGMIQPMVIASKEKVIDEETGIEYIEETPIPERIKRLANRVKAWVNLQEKPNEDKKIALIYYNYPPGKQNIGASYLNILPESLWEIYNRLKAEGYDLNSQESRVKSQELTKEKLFGDIHNYGRNIGNWAPGEIDRLARSGKPILIPIDTYKKWLEEMPKSLQKAMIKDWGEPEKSNVMTWQGASGIKYIVIPAVKYGNILFTPQPSKAWEQDDAKLYHNVHLAPHHQYVAFYLWLKKEFKADAIAHIGTHGTHEWLSGKEVGFTEEDPPEALIQDLPNIYPYIVDNVGEGTQAKRRGLAVIIDHMTPPFDKAGLNKELRELSGLINDYGIAKEKSPPLAQAKLDEINGLAKKMGILTDLKLKEIKTDDEIEELEHYIKDIAEKLTPFGLHTFGRLPDERYIKTTAEAVLSIEKGLSDEEKNRRTLEFEERIRLSAKSELDAFIAALSGKYIRAGQGNDPIRNPDAYPTGKNFYSFDPTKIPSKATYEMGARLAEELIDGYKQRHGQYPDKLTFNLWATETIRNEGIMQSQILYLMGIKPKWDERGRVIGVEVIPRKELGRQRIDVTIVPSGLYRDLFSNVMDLLDKAVTAAKGQDEEDNIIRANVEKTKKMLIEKGFDEDKAERLATIRAFTTPSGAYGPNLDTVINKSNTWDNEGKVVDVFFMRMSHIYGQGFWGEKIVRQSALRQAQGDSETERQTEDISLILFKNALSGTKIAIHSRSSNVIATLDNDDVFQYLGGVAMAVRSIDGKTPEVYITNLSNPKQPKQETIEKVMGREMRSRYLNPEWIKAMMKEGYAGARFIDKVVEHLWGWQVTVPEAVDAAKWNEMYETYVLDRNGLNIKEMFRESKNMWAYQSIVARMLETVRKDYWKTDKKVIETLANEYAETVKEVGLACCDHTCNNPLLTQFTSSVLISVPGLESKVQAFKKALEEIKSSKSQTIVRAREMKKSSSFQAPSAPGGHTTKVEGFEIQDMNASQASSAPIPYLFIIGFIIFIGLLMWGWRRKRQL